MPIYEYTCRACGHAFEILLLGSDKARCPACDSGRLKKHFSVFAAQSKSGGGAALPDPCASCGHPDGPGSCGMK